LSGTRISDFFAASIPFLIAEGTSFGFSDAKAHHPVAVADDDQGTEAQVLTALDDLGDAADVDDRVLQIQLRRARFSREFQT
jgi:hypothetical protein